MKDVCSWKKKMRDDTNNKKTVWKTIEFDMQIQTEHYKESKCHIKSLERQSFSWIEIMNEIKIEMMLAQLINVTSAVRADASKMMKLAEKTITTISWMRFQARNKWVWVAFTDATESNEIHNDCFQSDSAWLIELFFTDSII